jgi:hypothetical protein
MRFSRWTQLDGRNPSDVGRVIEGRDGDGRWSGRVARISYDYRDAEASIRIAKCDR